MKEMTNLLAIKIYLQGNHFSRSSFSYNSFQNGNPLPTKYLNFEHATLLVLSSLRAQSLGQNPMSHFSCHPTATVPMLFPRRTMPLSFPHLKIKKNK